MEFRFIGTGGAFDPQFGNSSALVTISGENILLDCGHSVFGTLFQKKLIPNIDAILLTHTHDDHCGSLGTLAFYYNKISPGKKLRMYYPTEGFLKEIKQFLYSVHCNPETHFDFVALSERNDISFIETEGKHVEGVLTHAYIFRENEHIFTYSGDLGDSDYLFSELEKLNIENITVFHEVIFHAGIPSHTYYRDLESHLGKFRIFGYHCNPGSAPPDNRIPLVANHPEWMI